jgi:DNA-binding transcriptional LysR family regulator
VVVSRSENRSVAAKTLGITQGAVTKHIQNLERWSQRILVQPNRSTELTKDGDAMLLDADKVVGLMAAARKLPVSSPEPKRISAKDLRVPPSVPKPPKA